MEWKKCTGGILVGLIVLCLAGCGENGGIDYEKEDNPRNIKIGVSVYDQYDTFVGSLAECLKVAAKQKEKEEGIGISVEVVTAGGKQSVQNDQVTDFIDSGYDILCVNLVDRTDATMIIDKAKNADVPIIFFNRELVREDLERWDKLYYVGASAAESGEMEGKIVADLCKGEENFQKWDKNGDGKLQYVLLEGEAGHQDALVRTECAIKVITEAGINLEKIGDEIANWNRDQGKTKMDLWMNEIGNDIELVLANNDDMALGAIDSWKESGKDEWPLIVGIDGTAPALREVQEGHLQGTVFNDAMGQAYSILELAYSLRMGTELPDDVELTDKAYVWLPYSIVTKDNVEEAIEKLNSNSSR